jgi:hypothetical protein
MPSLTLCVVAIFSIFMEVLFVAAIRVHIEVIHHGIT